MARPSRNKKMIDYSAFQDSDDDGDFACVIAPSKKRSRVPVKETGEKDERKTGSPPLRLQPGPVFGVQKERLSVEEKLLKRDIEAALTLSMLHNAAEQKVSPNDKDVKNPPTADPERTESYRLLSNCGVGISLLGLDQIKDERGDLDAPCRPRQSENQGDEDYQPNCSDSNWGSDMDSGDQAAAEGEVKVKVKVKSLGKKKKSKTKDKAATEAVSKKENRKSKPQAMVGSPVTVTPVKVHPPVLVRPATNQAELPATPPVSKPAGPLSPVGGRLPKWNPPGQVGRSPGNHQNVQVKSPGQGLRLGLSRLARVKPLHPSANH